MLNFRFRYWNWRTIFHRTVFPLVVVLIFLVTFAILVPSWCRSNPKWCNPNLFNMFNVDRPNDLDLDKENRQRSEAAVNYLKRFPTPTVIEHQSILTLGIVAKRRPYPMVEGKSIALQYLTQVASKLLEFVNGTSNWIRTVDLFVCNVDPEPNEFTEAVQLSKYVRVVKIIDHVGESKQKTSVSSVDDSYDQVFEQEKSDYSLCLKMAAKKTSHDGYVAIFQDDALPVDGFGSMVRSVVDQLENRRHRRSEIGHPEESVFVKFYHPEQYRKVPWMILVVAYSLAVTVSVFVLFHWKYGLTPINGKYYQRVLVGFLIFVYLIGVGWCLGHASMARIRYFFTGGSIYLVTQESCCIPAVLFTQPAAYRVAEYLDERSAKRKYTVDHMMDEIPSVVGLMTDTNLIRHIGRYTTLRTHPVNSDPCEIVSNRPVKEMNGNGTVESNQRQTLADAIDPTTALLTFFTPDQRDFTKVIDDLNKQAKKLSAAAHRTLVMNEARRIGSQVEQLSTALETALADKMAYNEFLRKRAEFWNTAAQLVREKAAGRTETLPLPEESLQNSVASESQMNGDSLASSASASVSVVSAGGSTKSEKEFLKKPLPLADRDFTAATLAYLQRDSPGNFARKLPVPPPLLDELQLQSTYVSNFNGATKKPQEAGVQNGKPQAAAAAPKGVVNKGYPVQRVEMVKTMADPVGRASGESSGGSMSGSFLDGNSGNDYNPHLEPIVKNLGFSSCLDDSAASSMGREPLAQSSLLVARENDPSTESNNASAHGELRRPPKLNLATTSLYSPDR